MTRSTRCDLLRAASLRRCIGALPFTAILLGASTAWADRDPAAAETLFKLARSLVEAGDYAAGCPKFEASLALNPSASTVINIAKCHEHEGKIAMAWEDYHRALVVNNHETMGAERKQKLESIANDGLAALAPRLPKLRIEVASPPAGLKVTRDNVEFPRAALGDALPLDPGAHQVSVSAPGFQAVTRAVTLEEGKTATVSITLIKEKDTPPMSEPKASGVPAWVWITGGGGLAFVGAGAFFLADHIAAIHALNAGCGSTDRGTYCKPGYDYQGDNARKNRDLALTIGLGSAGLLAIGVATFGLFRSLPAKTAAPVAAASAWISPGGAGAAIHGEF